MQGKENPIKNYNRVWQPVACGICVNWRILENTGREESILNDNFFGHWLIRIVKKVFVQQIVWALESGQFAQNDIVFSK